MILELRFFFFVPVSIIFHEISSEYIVSFNGYYKPLARKRFLTAALHDSGVLSWKIIPRDNLAYDYPSDFDVVKV